MKLWQKLLMQSEMGTGAGIELVGSAQAHGYFNATVTLPAGTIAGDFIVVVANAMLSTYPTMTTTGYTDQGSWGSSGRPITRVYTKFAGADTSVQVSFGSYQSGVVLVYVLRNVNTSSPLDVALLKGYTSTPPTITPVTPGALVINGVNWHQTTRDSGIGIYTAGTLGFITEHVNDAGYGTGDTDAAIGYRMWSGSGSVASTTWSPSIIGGSNYPISLSLAIRPA